MPPLEERVEYPYQNMRTKNFPWGDGDKTILYVLPHVLEPMTHLNCSVPELTTCNSWNPSVNYHNHDKVK